MGGIDLSPRNHYISAASLPEFERVGGAVRRWQPGEMERLGASKRPPKYGSIAKSAVPEFVTPILATRASREAKGWTVKISGKSYAVAVIPLQGIGAGGTTNPK